MKNNHTSYDINAYLDGTLPERKRKIVENHIAQCPACKNELEMMREAIEVISSKPLPPVPSDLLDNIKLAIDKTPQPRSFWWSIKPQVPAFSFGIAAGALATAIALIIVNHQISQNRSLMNSAHSTTIHNIAAPPIHSHQPEKIANQENTHNSHKLNPILRIITHKSDNLAKNEPNLKINQASTEIIEVNTSKREKISNKILSTESLRNEMRSTALSSSDKSSIDKSKYYKQKDAVVR